jgi:hypothetical protein
LNCLRMIFSFFSSFLAFNFIFEPNISCLYVKTRKCYLKNSLSIKPKMLPSSRKFLEFTFEVDINFSYQNLALKTLSQNIFQEKLA